MTRPKDVTSNEVKRGKLIAFPQKSSDGALVPHVSASSLKLYLTCSLRFYFKKVLQLAEPTSPALHLGKAVHAGIQAYWLARWRNEDASDDVVVSQYTSAFTALDQADPVGFTPAERSACLARGESVLRAYLDSEHARADAAPLGVEVRLEEHFAQLPSPLLGYIDLVRPGPIVCDFKTVASTPNLELEAFQHALQLTAYQLLVESATGQQVTARELVFLVKTKTPKVIVHRLPPADATEIERFWLMAERAVKGIYEEDWTPQPGMHCSWCSYRDACSRWKGCVS
jgi:putative RecB family exonuclease